MENSLNSLIENSQSILILLPNKPFFDQVAAGLSFYLSFQGHKQTTISCSSPMIVGFNRIIGINKISKDLGSKNLVLRFKEYDAGNIEKVSYDIDNGEFKLTVVPKVGFKSPEVNQLEVTTSGMSADLVILIGGANESHFPELSKEEFKGVKIVHLGTRVLNGFNDLGIMSLAKPASSTSELVANVIKDLGLEMDIDSASNLIMGIEEGSSHFESQEVTPETFETFAYLLRSGGRRQPKRLTPNSFPQGAIPNRPFNNVPFQPVQSEQDVQDVEGTQESEIDINPPSDWLQPKVFRGANTPPTNPDSFSENKG